MLDKRKLAYGRVAARDARRAITTGAPREGRSTLPRSLLSILDARLSRFYLGLVPKSDSLPKLAWKYRWNARIFFSPQS